MLINHGLVYRLKPTPKQENLFRQWAGACRAVYNCALEQRSNHWRAFKRSEGKCISFASQCRELTALRAGFDWIAACPTTPLQQTLRDLTTAYRNFFSGRAGYPTPRKKGVNDAFRFQGREVEIIKLNRNWAYVTLPKIGNVRFRLTRPVHGVVKNVTISLTPLGWHVSFACEIDIVDPPVNVKPAVGIDRGVANTTATSNGVLASIPLERLNVLDRRARKAQKDAAHRTRGSSRHKNAKRRLAKCKATAARVRKHWNHVETTRASRSFGTVCLEDLRIANMTRSAQGTIETPGTNVRQKAGLDRAILNQAWFQYETMLGYKLAAIGGKLIKVNPRNTSRTCHKCGSIDARSRESQASFRCVECSHEAHADVNAAKNILRAGTRPSESNTPLRESRCAA